jgi:hypothetical protein
VDRENGSTTWAWTGVIGVRGDWSSPASLDAHEMEPLEGEAPIHEPRLDQVPEPEGAKPGVGRPLAETGVVGASVV